MHPNLQMPIFKIFVSWRPKEVPKVPFSLGLEGILQLTIHFFNQTKETATKFELEKRKE